MTALLLEFVVRTLLIAAGTGIVLGLLRIKTAAARHVAWTAVLIAMLLLPIGLAGNLKVPVAVLPVSPGPTSTLIDRSDTSAAPAARETREIGPSPDARLVTSPADRVFRSLNVLLAIYVAGVILLLTRLAFGTVHAVRLRRQSIAIDGHLTSDRCATPVTIGWLAPALILPAGWNRWPAAQLDAVLTHERAHARRRDPLVQWLALLNRALFWFHPLAWWLERRLATLAEEACDAAVLAAGHAPDEYSVYLLDMARAVSRRGTRVQIAGMAMPGTGLKERLRLIFSAGSMKPLSRARVAGTAALCVLSSALFAAATPAPQSSGAMPQASVQPELRITFDAVVVKPCPENSAAPPGARGGGGGGYQTTSPGYVHWDCVTLVRLISEAYAVSEREMIDLLSPRSVNPPKFVRGGPSWVEHERYDVEVRMSGDTSDLTGSARVAVVRQAMRPALRAMLEDRFQLKVRRLSEQIPVYALTVGPRGPNKDRLRVPVEGDCRPAPVRNAIGDPAAPDDQRPICGGIGGGAGARERHQAAVARGTRLQEFASFTMAMLADSLSRSMDRAVVDRTGLEGKFNFGIEYVLNATMAGEIERNQRSRDLFASGVTSPRNDQPAVVSPDSPTIFQAIEVLGLKLAPAMGPVDYFQIDSVQRPRPNTPAFAEATPPARAGGPGPKR